jgi:alkyl hydroperoxide reductase subunit AhpF
VVRRTAAYSCRLRLSDGGTLTARSVVITTGVTYRRLGVPASRFGRKV